MADYIASPHHTHFNAKTVTSDDGTAVLNSPRPIILATEDKVWFVGDYSLEGIGPIERVSPLSNDGECVMTIPGAICEFWTEEEAQAIESAIDADEQLLRYARG